MPAFDFGELNTLIADLDRGETRMLDLGRKAVEVTLRSIDDDWTADAAAANPAHAKRYPHSIDYDITNRLHEIHGQVGPNLGRPQGSLGILDEAPGGVLSAPQGSREKALRRNVADFERGILKAAGEWLA